MTTLPTPVDYTDKDFDSITARVFDLIRSVFPNWTDTQVSNFGNLLVESYGFILDVLTYYQDQQAREGRFAFVKARKNMIALAKLIGYELSNAEAASADVVLTITNAAQLTGTVRPQTGTSAPVVVRTNEVTDPVRGELDAPVTFDLTAGETSKTFTWRHRTTQPRYTVASTNLADQEIVLPFSPFLWNSESVVSSVDGSFTRVVSFLSSGPTDLHYRLEVDQNDRARIRFGDGRNGKIPRGDIGVDYSTGGGILGNVEPNTLSRVETTLIDNTGSIAYFEASNAAAASGGTPREEVEAARYNAPQSIRVINRTVAREDYEINARRVAGVGRSLMLTSNEDTTVGENRGKLYVIPTTGGTPSQALINDVYGVFGLQGQVSPLAGGQTYPTTITFQLEVLPPAYLAINVVATVWLMSGSVASVVKTTIEDALEDFFSPMMADGTANPNIDFGFNYKAADGEPAGEIAWSDIFNIIRDASGVRKVAQDMTLNGAVDDVGIDNWEFPSLGTVTLINGDTGGAM